MSGSLFPCQTIIATRALRLLGHWLRREPWGPCHYGIGTQFFKIEYPMIRYYLLGFVYILSLYKAAVGDFRFHEALKALAYARYAEILRNII